MTDRFRFRLHNSLLPSEETQAFLTWKSLSSSTWLQLIFLIYLSTISLHGSYNPHKQYYLLFHICVSQLIIFSPDSLYPIPTCLNLHHLSRFNLSVPSLSCCKLFSLTPKALIILYFESGLFVLVALCPLLEWKQLDIKIQVGFISVFSKSPSKLLCT